MKKKPRILLIYDYFDPATLAGGPIVSCANLVEYLHDEVEFYIFTTNRDLDNSILPVEKNEWLSYKKMAKIFYASGFFSLLRYFRFVKKFQPDIIYINGVYSFSGVVIPLLIRGFFLSHSQVVIAPRGMLLTDALDVKRLKKKLYLTVFRRLVAMNSVQWHVTGEQEKRDLLYFLGDAISGKITSLGNVPSSAVALGSRNKNQAVLSLLTIALISPMKNILNVIKALQNVTETVVYTLYGTIKDRDYWQQCLKEMTNLPQSITFHYGGVAARKDIPAILARHDVYIQPSKSENFSHSIYEALMSGMPTITSHNTPWNVGEEGAGWNVDGDDPNALVRAISEAGKLNDDEYATMSNKARLLGEEYLLRADLRAGYRTLFR